jgi:hypothetical protein
MISDPELGVLVLKCFTVVQALGWMLANQGGPLRNIGRRLPGKLGGFLLVGIVGGVSVLLYSISQGMRPGA